MQDSHGHRRSTSLRADNFLPNNNQLNSIIYIIDHIFNTE